MRRGFRVWGLAVIEADVTLAPRRGFSALN